MNHRLCARAAWLALVPVCLFHAPPLGAHRLDEYLQAARVLVAVDRVSLELDLTAGVAVAPAVFALMDLDRNRQVSAAEADLYARRVLGAIELRVDGQPVPLRLDSREMPTWAEVSGGEGVVRLRASAAVPPAGTGTHRVVFRNSHEPKMSVYLANALVPADARIRITEQLRDLKQRELTIGYTVTAGAKSR